MKKFITLGKIHSGTFLGAILLIVVTLATIGCGKDVPSPVTPPVVPPVVEPIVTVAGAPTIGTVIAEDKKAFVPITKPSSDGGSPIESYTITSSPATIPVTVLAANIADPVPYPGLSNDVAYTFTATAKNGKGNSTASAVSNTVTPMDPNKRLLISKVWIGSTFFEVQTPPSTTWVKENFLIKSKFSFYANGKFEQFTDSTNSKLIGNGNYSITYDGSKTILTIGVGNPVPSPREVTTLNSTDLVYISKVLGSNQLIKDSFKSQ